MIDLARTATRFRQPTIRPFRERLTTLWPAAANDGRALVTGALVLGSAFALSLLAARILRAETWEYRFLVKNLFLAWMPFWLALALDALDALDRRRASLPALLAVGAAWLLFFPNAPYLITDFVHLYQRHAVPLWFDILMLTAFAWNGLLLGFASLRLCHRVAERRVGVAGGWALVVVSLVLAGFGIYLGRFVRFHSWHLLTDPLTILADIGGRVLNPAAHPRTWGMTAVIGGFLCLGYATLLTLAGLNRRRDDDGRRAAESAAD